MKSRQTISPKQFAAALGVSESSIKRWCDQGTLPASRTPGGHRRIPVEAAVAFARQSGRPIARPDLLGMPTSRRSAPLKEVLPLFTRELLDGHEQSLREMTYDLFVQHGSLANVFDEVLRPSLETISLGCEDGSVKQFERRRALSVLSSILIELRSELPPPADGPLACGATTDNKSLGICSKMTELILRSEGWNTISFGAQCPAEIILEAGRAMTPDLVWFGTSVDENREKFTGDCQGIANAMAAQGIPAFFGTPFEDAMPEFPGNTRASNSLVVFTEFLRKIHRRPPSDDQP